MATKKTSIPAVPRGLTRELTFFLESLAQNVRTLTGTGTAPESQEAVTRGNAFILQTGTQQIGSNAVGTSNLEANSVTTSKLADLSVTSEKIADSSVTNAKLSFHSVTSDKIGLAAIGFDKLDASAMLTQEKHVAFIDGTITTLNNLFLEVPMVFITRVNFTSEAGASVDAGIVEVRFNEELADWEVVTVGSIEFIAVGYA